MKPIIRIAVWGTVAVAALYTLLNVKVGVSFDRPVPLDNDPLTNSTAVTSISSNRLTLSDGRVLLMEGLSPAYLAEEMRDSEGRVELDPVTSGFSHVFVKRRRFICGTYAPRVVIPLLRREYPAYERRFLGFGTFQ